MSILKARQHRSKSYISLENTIEALVRIELKESAGISEQDARKYVAEHLHKILDKNVTLYKLYRNEWEPARDGIKVYASIYLDKIHAPEYRHPSYKMKSDKEKIANAGKETGFKIAELAIHLPECGTPEQVYQILAGHKPPKGTFPVIKGTLLTGGVEIKPEQPAPIQGRQELAESAGKESRGKSADRNLIAVLFMELLEYKTQADGEKINQTDLICYLIDKYGSKFDGLGSGLHTKIPNAIRAMKERSK